MSMMVFLLIAITSLQAQSASKITPNLAEKLSELQSQDQVAAWIYFTDKGQISEETYNLVASQLPENSIKRRSKNFKNKNNLVTFYDIPVNQEYIDQLLPSLKELRRTSRWLNAISAEIEVASIKKIEQLPFVKKIDILHTLKRSDQPAIDESDNLSEPAQKDPAYNLDYGNSITQNEQINVPEAHDLGFSGAGVIICMMDAGFNNLEHSCFNSITILDAYDFVNDDDNVDDEDDMGTGGHGTKTLSTIGGFDEGSLIGPAYGASYILAKTENNESETHAEEDAWIAAFEWAEMNYGPDITSTSLSYTSFDDGSEYSPEELDGNTAIITVGADIAASLGILVVNSAGNYGPGPTTIGAPADGDSVMAVGAVTSDGSLSGFSSWGPTGDGRIKPDVCAMGSGVVVASSSGDGYGSSNGTSFSCPLTAGAAALLMEMVPNASNMDIFDAMKMTGDHADQPDNMYGWGIIDVMAAYNYLLYPMIYHDPLMDTENFLGPYVVEAAVVSHMTLIDNSPVLYYRIDEGEWNEVVMETSDDEIYTGEIPGTATEAEVDYYIVAENTNGPVSLPETAPDEYFSFSVAIDETAPVLSHNPIYEYYINLWNQAGIFAEITDNMGVNSENVLVEWQLNGNVMTNFYLENVEDDYYYGTFPETEIELDDIVEYKIFASDISTNENTVMFPESGFQEFVITDRISFEQNAFSHNWFHEGEDLWTITDEEALHGNYSAMSGTAGLNEISAMSLFVDAEEDGVASFHYKVSTANNDLLVFLINGEMEENWSGEIDWTYYEIELEAGEYSLTWVYYRGGTNPGGQDRIWVDNIKLPGPVQINDMPGIPSIPNGETSLCQNSANTEYETTATNNADSYEWAISPSGAGTISGDGFTASVDWYPTYAGTASIRVRGVNDFGSGFYSEILEVTVTRNPVAEFDYTTSGLEVDFENTSNYADSYLWDFGDGGSSEEENPTHSYNDFGNYNISLTAISDMCGDSVVTQTIELITSISDLALNQPVYVYPNPSAGKFYIQVENEMIIDQMQIIDQQGKIIFKSSEKIENNQLLNFSGFNQGVYYLKITSAKRVFNQKIIVN